MVLPLALFAQRALTAVTTEGRDVLLSPDGTWKYAERTPSTEPSSNEARGGHARPASATNELKAKVGSFKQAYDPNVWTPAPVDDSIRQMFSHKSGSVFGMLISEGIPVPTETLRKIALMNVKTASGEEAEVEWQEQRIVNGVSVSAVRFSTVMEGIPLTYLAYYFGGKSGAVQAITFTSQLTFDQYEQEMTAFLDGLLIDDEPAPAPEPSESSGAAGGIQTLTLNDGAYSVEYDAAQWSSEQKGDTGRYAFVHKDGIGYGLVIVERIGIPMNTLPGIILSNAQNADPDARILRQEMVTHSGVELWEIEIEVTAKGIPLIFHGYYFGAEQGTIQVISYTSPALHDKHLDVLLSFIRGLRIGDTEQE